MSSDDLRSPVVDLRLVPAAIATWGVTLLGLLFGWVPSIVAVGAATVGLVVVWLVARSRRWANGMLAVLVMVVVAGAGMAVRTHQLEHHPLRLAAERGAHASVRITLRERPKPLKGASYGARRAQDRSIVRGDLHWVDGSGRRLRVGGTVVLLVPTRQWAPLIAGQQVTVEGRAVPPRSGELVAAVVQSYRPPEQVGAAPGWQRAAEGLREGLRRVSTRVLEPDAAALLPGLVVGDTAAMESATRLEFETAGLSHLTAVSGANLAIVCGAVLFVLHLAGVGPVVSAVAAGAALAGFVVLAGPEPSVLRAAVMGAIGLGALVMGRQRSAVPALATAVIGLVLFIPGMAASAGFALSVVATAGLVLIAPGWTASLRRRGLPAGLAEAVAAPAAAQLVTAPLVAALSGTVSVVSVVANLLVTPVIAPATVLGVVATACVPVAPWIAELSVAVAAPGVAWILAVARHASAIPGATFDWPSGTVGGLLLAVASIVVLIVLRGRRMRWVAATLVLIAGIVLVPSRVVPTGWPEDGWSMVACDVGQGDALVLATGVPGEAVVVDTGPDPALMGKCLRRLGIQRIPLVVLTHLHADHVGGLPTVLAEHPVAAVGIGPLREPAWAMVETARDARAKSVPVITMSAGQRMRWPSLVLDVIGPAPPLASSRDAEDANDASVVLRASTPVGRILLTGDIELLGQSALVSAGADLRADVLKVPHHGSRYTTPRFLNAVRPRLALISVGDGNDYGHPSPLILAELARIGAEVLRTDREGDIAVLGRPSRPLVLSRGDPVRAEDR